MFDYNHYVPILKGKDGEFKALKSLTSGVRSNLTPMIDIPRQDLDWNTKLPKESIDTYLVKKARKISNSWGMALPIFVDIFDLDVHLTVSSGQHINSFLFEKLRCNYVKAIPVIGLDRMDIQEYVNSIIEIEKIDQRGVCIRLLTEDVEDFDESFNKIDSLMDTIKVNESSVHLLIDYRNVGKDDLEYLKEISLNFLSTLPSNKDLQTITLASCGFPENLGGVSPESTVTIQRLEFDLRNLLLKNKRHIPRLPAFGDYGICHPDLLDFQPHYSPSAAIRYTIAREWLIIKARSLKLHGYEQFHTLSDMLRKRPEYYGADYSWGDNYISQCADCLIGPGNLTIWRQVGTSHHLTLVSEQLANLS